MDGWIIEEQINGWMDNGGINKWTYITYRQKDGPMELLRLFSILLG